MLLADLTLLSCGCPLGRYSWCPSGLSFVISRRSPHQCISAPESRAGHTHLDSQSQGLSSTPLLCCCFCCCCPSQLAPPPVPPPPRATWHLVSAHVPGRVSLPGVPGLLTRTQCQTQPTGDFPDPPKRPPARPPVLSCPLRYHHLISPLPPEQSPCIPYQETTHHSALPRTPVSLSSLWHFLLSKSPERDRVLDCACASECDCDCAILTD